MRKIAFTLILLSLFSFSLQAYSFENLRSEQRGLVLKEFKKLFKQRKNIHQNIRQVLRHARSKNLQKNSISYFQSRSSLYEKKYQIEPVSALLDDTVVETVVENDSSSDVVDTAISEKPQLPLPPETTPNEDALIKDIPTISFPMPGDSSGADSSEADSSEVGSNVDNTNSNESTVENPNTNLENGGDSDLDNAQQVPEVTSQPDNVRRKIVSPWSRR